MHGVTPVIFAQGAMVCERSRAYVVQLRKPPTSYLPASNASWSAKRLPPTSSLNSNSPPAVKSASALRMNR